MTVQHPEANPGELVAVGVERTLELARSWLAWDGQPVRSEDGSRLYTPNKVLRSACRSSR